jgi:hypothetical protein
VVSGEPRGFNLGIQWIRLPVPADDATATTASRRARGHDSPFSFPAPQFGFHEGIFDGRPEDPDWARQSIPINPDSEACLKPGTKRRQPVATSVSSGNDLQADQDPECRQNAADFLVPRLPGSYCGHSLSRPYGRALPAIRACRI